MGNVTLEGLTKRYRDAEAAAVDDVSLDIANGEFMVLLGPSGCGKSTTLRMIAGLEPISDGTLRIDGEVMNRVPARDRDIAMVFQSYALYPHMTVFDNLAFGLKRRGFAREEINRRVNDAAGILGLSPYLARKPHALSGGQRQRVALGRAIVRDPKVFLFDEPLSNLDAALRVNMRNELVKLHQRLGTTMIYVTHDQVEAMSMGSRICIMQDGRVAQVGRPLDVYRYPANTFVASFLGSPQINLVEAAVEPNHDGGRVLDVGGARIVTDCPPDRSRVIAGIRPEDFYLPGEAPGDAVGATLDARVLAVEALGAETVLLLDVDGVDKDLTARVGRSARTAVGDLVRLTVDTRALRLFDADTGLALER